MVIVFSHFRCGILLSNNILFHDSNHKTHIYVYLIQKSQVEHISIAEVQVPYQIRLIVNKLNKQFIKNFTNLKNQPWWRQQLLLCYSQALLHLLPLHRYVTSLWFADVKSDRLNQIKSNGIEQHVTNFFPLSVFKKNRV